MNADPWFRRFRQVPDPRLHLVCFPHAGGAASHFRGWQEQLPPDIQLWAVRYPGRQDRLLDPCVPDIHDLAVPIAEALVPLTGSPLVLFGHSMGAIVAYEVAQRLEKLWSVVLAGLFVSGQVAPHRITPGDLHRRGDEALLADVRRLGNHDADAYADHDLREFLLPALRADYTAIETYRPSSALPVTTPVVVYAGDNDPDVPVSDLPEWAHATTGSCQLRTFSGDHFYLVDHEAELLQDLVTKLGDGVAV